MIKDCKHCGKLSEIAPTKHKENGVWVHQIECVRCKQSVRRNTREAVTIAWNCEQSKLWDDKTEEAFNRIMAGGVENA